MKVIIAGGRDFNDYELVKKTLNNLLTTVDEEIEIVSGGAPGADRLGICYARDNKYQLTVFIAKWDMYGKSAGPRRNLEMAEYATHCVCFWDGKSKGTADMIAKAHDLKLITRVVRY